MEAEETMTGGATPATFVWTKIQADAGETIQRILNRKELERQAGNGTFWWGIGESKAAAINLLAKKELTPELLFSLMRSPPHVRDTAPSGVLIWQAYQGSQGIRPLPPHVVVTSREHASNGRPKQRHYALVCEAHTSILRNDRAMLDVALLRNTGKGKPVGSSQVTAVVEIGSPNGRSTRYQITARAVLVGPYAVTLASPRELSLAEQRLLADVGNIGMTSEDWLAVAKRIRRL
jgi:hypothetical protein